MSVINSSSSSSSSKVWLIQALAVGAVAFSARSRSYLARSWRVGSRVIGIIPARFASTRFQGKPLVYILGKPMIQPIQVDHQTHGVDIPEDVDKIERFMRERNLS